MAITQARAFGACAGRRYGSFERAQPVRDVERITQARAAGAHTGARYGDFDRSSGEPRPVGILTQPRAFGAHTGRRYGAFDRGGESGRTVGRLTQLRAFGAHTGGLYGDFTGRAGPAPVQSGGGRFRPLPRELDNALRRRAIQQDELLLLLASCLDGNSFLH